VTIRPNIFRNKLIDFIRITRQISAT